jgi:hypothetical protein
VTDLNNQAVLLSTAYFPPIQYFTKLSSHNNIYLECHENFSKQSYRNRCTILGSNGPLDISIPIKKENALKTSIRDVKIDYSTPWKKVHLRAVESAYRSSPFYLYYIDDIASILEKNRNFLFDLNLELINLMNQLIGLSVQLNFTEDFKTLPFSFVDFSDSIHPKNRMKKPDNNFFAKSYYQVFVQKFGFIPNLSILDLLFNEGPNTQNILLQCLKPES